MENKPTNIELPRLENERAERYQARVEYITAGANRSLRDLARKLDKSLTVVGRWSAEDDWQKHAADYDQTVYTLAAQDAADAYRADLADYRKRYGDMGKALYSSAAKLLKKINKVLDSTDVASPSSLLTVINAAKTAADLEALALRVENLLNEPRSE